MTAPVLDRATILSLVPHQGAMCLWDEVVAWSADAIRLRARNHRDPAHPLRRDGRLHALHLCEYGAQAMAVHGGLLARERDAVAAPGLLVALRGVVLHATRLDDLTGALECEAQALVRGGDGQQYTFRITHAGALLAEGCATVMTGSEV